MDLLTFDELFDRLRAGDESTEIEAKRASELGASIMETVSAFANEPGLGGGYLLLGVAQVEEDLPARYEIVGVPDVDRLQRELATRCRDMLCSPVRPQITVETRNNKNVVVCYIPEAQPHEKPLYITSRGLPHGAFRRVGSTDQHCTDDDIALFHQARGVQTYDELVLTDSTLEDIDPLATAEYRRARAELSPAAAELAYSDDDLLYSLGATARRGGKLNITLAGMMLFGNAMALRRYFPMTRIDYIRVDGREWVKDPDARYQTIELREPLMLLVPRIITQVLADVPQAFSLGADRIHRLDSPVIPRTVIREAVVNALMHRNYRQQRPVQIIRYANRLEIRNPGYSLVPDERLGEPGSVPRNPKIAAVLHEVGLAETKGTGIRAMRQLMHRANLTQPLFESDRKADSFTVTLLAHQLLGPDDVEWLGRFRDCHLSADDARALIVVRELGALSNLVYRDVNGVDTLTASARLRRLPDIGLLEQQGKGSATLYLPADRVRASPGAQLELPLNSSDQDAISEHLIDSNESLVDSNESLVDSNESLVGNAVLENGAHLPIELAAALKVIGQRASIEAVQEVIIRLCAWRELQLSELADFLRRDPHYIRMAYLRPMLQQQILEHTIPGTPSHPMQAYRLSPAVPRSN